MENDGNVGMGVFFGSCIFSMHVDPVRLKCNNTFVGPLHRRKDPHNSL